MRTLIVTLVILGGALTLQTATGQGSAPAVPVISAVAVLHADAPNAPAPTAQTAQPQGAPSIHVDINKGGGGRAWYANPVWMAIGGIALVLVILLIVMAARGGGGTTVVRG